MATATKDKKKAEAAPVTTVIIDEAALTAAYNAQLNAVEWRLVRQLIRALDVIDGPQTEADEIALDEEVEAETVAIVNEFAGREVTSFDEQDELLEQLIHTINLKLQAAA